MEYSVDISEAVLAAAEEECGTERVWLSEIRLPWDDLNFATHGFYVVRHRVMDWDSACWDAVFNDLRGAVAAFGKEANKKVKVCGKGLEKAYGPVSWTDDWAYRRGELIPDESGRHSEKDYGPSNPWDAPGMKISDFVPGAN